MSDFDRFFRIHSQPIYSYLRRLTGDPERSDDLFQRVFLKAYTHFEGRNASASDRAWIFTIATNEARDDIRRRRREFVKPMELPDIRAQEGPDPSLSAEDRELAREILREIGELPTEQREVFLLVRYHGFSFAQAALLCGIGLSAAKMSVARTHEKLLRALGSRIHMGSLL